MHHTLSHVFFQSTGNAEGHLAESAFEGVIASSAVGLHVSCQLGALSTGVRTQFTFVWLLSCVAASVNCQVGTVLENLATKLAGVLTTSS